MTQSNIFCSIIFAYIL